MICPAVALEFAELVLVVELGFRAVLDLFAAEFDDMFEAEFDVMVFDIVLDELLDIVVLVTFVFAVLVTLAGLFVLLAGDDPHAKLNNAMAVTMSTRIKDIYLYLFDPKTLALVGTWQV